MQSSGHFFTSVLSILFLGKYTLTNSDTETIKKVFRYQKEMYLNIVASKDGTPIPVDIAKTQIDKLLVDIQKDDELFLVISEELRQSLETYKKSPSLKESILNVQQQIDADFEDTKYKLGYPSNKHEFFFFKVVKGIQLFTWITVIFFALVLLCKWYVDGSTLIALFYWTIFSVVTSIFSTMYTKKHSFFNRKFNKELLNLPIDLITKFQNTIIQLIRQQ